MAQGDLARAGGAVSARNPQAAALQSGQRHHSRSAAAEDLSTGTAPPARAPLALPHIPPVGSVFLVHRHDAGAAQSNVVLQRDARTFYLTLVGFSLKLPDELRALGETGGA